MPVAISDSEVVRSKKNNMHGVGASNLEGKDFPSRPGRLPCLRCSMTLRAFCGVSPSPSVAQPLKEENWGHAELIDRIGIARKVVTAKSSSWRFSSGAACRTIERTKLQTT